MRCYVYNVRGSESHGGDDSDACNVEWRGVTVLDGRADRTAARTGYIRSVVIAESGGAGGTAVSLDLRVCGSGRARLLFKCRILFMATSGTDRWPVRRHLMP